METQITTFYHFTKLASTRIEVLKTEIINQAKKLSISGLIIMGTEGVNSTVAGGKDAIKAFKEYLLGIPELDGMLFKDSFSDRSPFKRFKVKVRPEIVTLANPELVPGGENHHLTPTEWRQVIERESDVTIIDTRNWYEVELGKFKGAIDPRIEMFNEFPDFVSKLRVPKDKKVLMYCTGGIRCEKAILEMQRQGYDNVYQLQGGILKYLEEYPNDLFDGECFVFDHRVAVGQDLRPTQVWDLCPLCGNPGKYKLDSCSNCSKPGIICDKCAESELLVCSKNCRHHFLMKKSGHAHLG